MPEMALENVVLVDEEDHAIGVSEKLVAHRRGLLHRAFSIVIFDAAGRLLLQQRHIGKYHSGGLWANACCGHPRPGEAAQEAAERRLAEEMGFTCRLVGRGTLLYRADVGSGLVEHELVHVFAGRYGGPVAPAPDECDAYRWMDIRSIEEALASAPASFAAWFHKYAAAGWPLQPPPSA